MTNANSTFAGFNANLSLEQQYQMYQAWQWQQLQQQAQFQQNMGGMFGYGLLGGNPATPSGVNLHQMIQLQML